MDVLSLSLSLSPPYLPPGERAFLIFVRRVPILNSSRADIWEGGIECTPIESARFLALEKKHPFSLFLFWRCPHLSNTLLDFIIRWSFSTFLLFFIAFPPSFSTYEQETLSDSAVASANLSIWKSVALSSPLAAVRLRVCFFGASRRRAPFRCPSSSWWWWRWLPCRRLRVLYFFFRVSCMHSHLP